MLYKVLIYEPFEAETTLLFEHPCRVSQKHFHEIVRQVGGAAIARVRRAHPSYVSAYDVAQTLAKGLGMHGFVLLHPGKQYLASSVCAE